MATYMNKGSNALHFEQEDGLYRIIFDAANDGMILSDLETGLVVETNPAACKMHGYTREEFIGLPLTAIMHPDDKKEFDVVIQAFQLPRIFGIPVNHVRRDGSGFPGEWHGSVLEYRGRQYLLIVVRDICKRIQKEKSLQGRVEAHTLEQATLFDISLALATKLEFQPGLILDQLRKIIQYANGGLFGLENSSLVALAMRGTPQLEQASLLRIRLNDPDSLIAMFIGREPIRIADVWGDHPQAQFLRSLLDDGAAVLLEGMQSWMWVPLAVNGAVIGGIGVAEAKKDYFTAHHANLALSVANMAAIAMTNAKLYQRAQELAVLEERQQLARNLHDAINQSLFSAGLIAEVLPRLWERDQEEARASIQDLLRLMRGAQAEMRTLLAELRPATLTDSNLDDLLLLLGNAFSGRTNIPVTIAAVEDLFLPAKVQLAFYRVCQEALLNIGKHAKASQVKINLHQEGSDIELSICDDGQGFDPKQSFSGHYGLAMMRERAEAEGALFSITSQPGHGAEIKIRWTTPPSEEV
jgi:two-component system nitrate/nitrite sensor histidine kinase NarX